MKHFFSKSVSLSPEELGTVRKEAEQALKTKKLHISEMKNVVNLISFNSNSMTEYISAGLDRHVLTKFHQIPGQVNADVIRKTVDTLRKKEDGTILGIVLENVQIKEIGDYLDLLFCLKELPQESPPLVLTHFSNRELVDYLCKFLEVANPASEERKIEVFRKNNLDEAWKTFTESSSLRGVETEITKPIVLAKPFFSEIQLVIPQGEKTNKIESYTLGSLRSVAGIFNKVRQGGTLIKSDNSIFLTPDQIAGFKFASAQDPSFRGVSINGDFASTSQFISKDIGLNFNAFGEIEYFRIGKGTKQKNIPPNAITKMEVQLGNQQMILDIGIGEDDFHVGNFHRVQLSAKGKSAEINKIVPFEKGASNDEDIQRYFDYEYTLFEMVQKIKEERIEGIVLKERKVTTGDVMTQMAFENLHSMGIFPMKTKCIGYGPEHLNNYDHLIQFWKKEVENIQNNFREILDVAQTPYFVEQNFKRLCKKIIEFLELKDLKDLNLEDSQDVIGDLEGLLKYMDDFFKLDIYKYWNKDLETDNYDGEEKSAVDEKEQHRLEKGDTNFIGENFQFFNKRKLVSSCLLKMINLEFFLANMQEAILDESYTPDLVIFSNNASVWKNYEKTAFPSTSLTSLSQSKVFQSRGTEEDLEFIQFMRGFTGRIIETAEKAGQTFHHQYKHSLSELGFILQEKLTSLQDELAFLENPENREEIYTKLLEQVTALYQKNLKDKEENLESLKKEKQEILDQIPTHVKALEELMEREIPDEMFDEMMETTPALLEEQKQEILRKHGEKKQQVNSILSVLQNFFVSVQRYFTYVLSVLNQYLKAQMIHAETQMKQKMIPTVKEMFSLDDEALEEKITLWKEAANLDAEQATEIKGEIRKRLEKIKEGLVELKEVPLAHLFQDKDKEQGILDEYIHYYAEELKKLVDAIQTLQTVFLNLNNLEQQFYKKQSELVTLTTARAEHLLLVKFGEMIQANPDCKEDISAILSKKEKIPKEIREDLNTLRNKMQENMKGFKTYTLKGSLEETQDFEDVEGLLNKRIQINEEYKELVNLVQGREGIAQEIIYEKEDLEFLRSQEDKLDEIVMSKTLPSTRVLLKTQYIPLVERDLSLLARANDFLGELNNVREKVNKHIQNIFFRKRYGFQQFLNAYYCMDNSSVAKSYTSKNVNGAYMMLSERYRKGCSPAHDGKRKIDFKKVDVLGINGVKNKMTNMWEGENIDGVLFLPSSIDIEGALSLCEYKKTLAQGNPVEGKSVHSLVLVYIHEINFEKIEHNSHMMKIYNRAILSNIFINIDGATVYNNRDSIYEAVVRSTFGACNSKMALNILRSLFEY